MNLDRSLALVYLALGILSGYISNILGSLLLSIILPVAVYTISLIVLARIVKDRKLSWLIGNTVWIFVLVWLTTWVFLFNLL
jgi:hypothetical protein